MPFGMSLSSMGRLWPEDRDKHSNLLPLFSHKIISLWDMKDLCYSMVHVTSHVNYFVMVAEEETKNVRWTVTESKKVQANLQQLIPALESMELTTTLTACQETLAELQAGMCGQKRAEQLAKELRTTFRRECEGVIFVSVPRTFMRYYEDRRKDGEPIVLVVPQEVHDNFPTVRDEIMEAGKCIALGRNTACVYHLLRGMEVGLESLARAVGVTTPKDNWGAYLNAIESALKTTFTPKNAAERDYYSQCASFFHAVKVAWRNPTMHIEKTYTSEHAEEIFGSVKTFMRHLAAKLKE